MDRFEDPPVARLDFIRPRLTRRIKKARVGRLARFMGKLRIGLPIGAGVLILALLIWPFGLPTFTPRNLLDTMPDLVINNLHYTGTDSKNEPFSLQAARATRPAGLHGVYDLIQPEGEITLQNNSWIDSRAETGRFDEGSKQLALGGHVHLFRDDGLQIITEEAQIKLDTQEAWGNKPILIRGEFGSLQGQGFRFLNGGQGVSILGPAKAILTERQEDK